MSQAIVTKGESFPTGFQVQGKETMAAYRKKEKPAVGQDLLSHLPGGIGIDGPEQRRAHERSGDSPAAGIAPGGSEGPVRFDPQFATLQVGLWLADHGD